MKEKTYYMVVIKSAEGNSNKGWGMGVESNENTCPSLSVARRLA